MIKNNKDASEDFKSRKSPSFYSGIMINKNMKQEISSITTYHEAGADVHYLMDLPSPKFSSAMGEVEEDEERNEIIRCILHHENATLK